MRKLIVPIFFALGLLCLLAAPALASAKTFYVAPTGNDDTHNIQKAFDAAAKAPGSTVQLGPYSYYTNTIFVKNFDGYIKGAGKGATTIDTLRGLDPSAPGLPPTHDPSNSLSSKTLVEPVAFLFGFKGGNVRVSGLSFHVTAPDPARPVFFEGGTQTALLAIVLVTGNASSSFDRVGFAASAGDFEGYNADGDLMIGGKVEIDSIPGSGWPTFIGPMSGVHTVTRCTFTGHSGVYGQGFTSGSLTIGGCAAQQNRFDVSFTPCGLIDNSKADITVSYNRMSCSEGDDLWIWQGFASLPPLPAPRYCVSHNDMSATGYAGGVLLLDGSDVWYGAPNRLDATIADNTITLNNDGIDGGIDGFFAQGIRVLDNRISGIGLAGIDVGATWAFGPDTSAPASGWQIIGNDVSGLSPANPYTSDPAAQIWLGPDADHCLVVGGCKPTTVLDKGIKDVLINVTKLDPPAAAATPMNSMEQTKSPKEMRRF
jgi:hypothetical protein